MRITTVALALFAAVSSASAADRARIYVYAQRETAARSWVPISCGNATVAEVKRGTFFAINVPSGRYVLGAKDGLPLFVDVASGEESFVRLDWHYEIGRPAVPTLAKVRPRQARKEMRYLSYISAKRVYSVWVPRADPRPPRQPQLERRGEP